MYYYVALNYVVEGIGMLQPFLGNYERIVGMRVCVKVRSDFIEGKVTCYYNKSRTFGVRCADGKFRKVKTVYVEQGVR